MIDDNDHEGNADNVKGSIWLPLQCDSVHPRHRPLPQTSPNPGIAIIKSKLHS